MSLVSTADGLVVVVGDVNSRFKALDDETGEGVVGKSTWGRR